MSRERLIDSRFSGIRTNLNQNPRAGLTSSATAGYWLHQAGTGETGTFARVTGAADGPIPGVSTYYRWTVATAKTAGTSGVFARNGSAAPTTSMGGVLGDAVAASMYVRPSVALSLVVALTPRLAGAVSGTNKSSSAVACPANTWTRLSVTHVTTAAYDDVQVMEIESAAMVLPVGGTMDVACVLVEKSAALGTWFDGVVPNAKFVGTAHASSSVGFGFVRLI